MDELCDKPKGVGTGGGCKDALAPENCKYFAPCTDGLPEIKTY